MNQSQDKSVNTHLNKVGFREVAIEAPSNLTIIILPAMKGNTTGIMDMEDYKTKLIVQQRMIHTPIKERPHKNS